MQSLSASAFARQNNVDPQSPQKPYSTVSSGAYHFSVAWECKITSVGAAAVAAM